MERLAGLQSLGVDIYTPRRELPRARASIFSLQRVAPVAATPAIETGGPVSARPAVDSERPSLDVELPQAESKAVRRPKPAVKAVAGVDSVRFQLLTVAFSSGILFVSDLKSAPLQPALEATVIQFLREVMFALGHPETDAVAPAYFQWPLVSKPGVDASAARAREVLAGFIERSVRETQPKHVVLLGERAAEYVQAEVVQAGKSPPQLWHFDAPLGKLFARPRLKADLWKMLQPLVIDD